jgi:hypothetical protein
MGERWTVLGLAFASERALPQLVGLLVHRQ